jgi:hypothetical protein
MRHALFSTSIDSSTPAISQKTPTEGACSQWLLEVLHHSRRLQAQRILGQYRHPIAPPQAADATSNVGVRKMSVAELPSSTKTSFQIPTPSAKVLIAVIAVAFLVLHIAAGVMLINASKIAATTAQEEARASLYD